jgi:hypothetical protein
MVPPTREMTEEGWQIRSPAWPGWRARHSDVDAHVTRLPTTRFCSPQRPPRTSPFLLPAHRPRVRWRSSDTRTPDGPGDIAY